MSHQGKITKLIIHTKEEGERERRKKRTFDLCTLEPSQIRNKLKVFHSQFSQSQKGI